METEQTAESAGPTPHTRVCVTLCDKNLRQIYLTFPNIQFDSSVRVSYCVYSGPSHAFVIHLDQVKSVQVLLARQSAVLREGH